MYLDFFPPFPEASRAGYAISLFIVVLLVVNLMAAGLLLLWRHHQKIKYWSQPPLQIPSHFEEVRGDFWSFSCRRKLGGNIPKSSCCWAEIEINSDVSELCLFWWWCLFAVLLSWRVFPVSWDTNLAVFSRKNPSLTDPGSCSSFFAPLRPQAGAHWEQRGFVEQGLEPGLSRNRIWKSKRRLFLINKLWLFVLTPQDDLRACSWAFPLFFFQQDSHEKLTLGRFPAGNSDISGLNHVVSVLLFFLFYPYTRRSPFAKLWFKTSCSAQNSGVFKSFYLCAAPGGGFFLSVWALWESSGSGSGFPTFCSHGDEWTQRK